MGKKSMRKVLEELEQRVERLSKLQVKVGWLESSTYESGVKVAAVATVHEYGSKDGKTPPRPFLRNTAQEQESKWKKEAEVLASRLIDGKITANSMLEVVGEAIKGDVYKTLAEMKTPPLKQSTIKARQRKAKARQRKTRKSVAVSTQPLNDTGYMRSTLGAWVVKKGEDSDPES